MVTPPLDKAIAAARDRIKKTKDTTERPELIRIRDDLITLKKKQLLAQLDKDTDRYREIIEHLDDIVETLKKTTDAIKAASDAAALLVKISALFSGL